jgi:adenylate cyclase
MTLAGEAPFRLGDVRVDPATCRVVSAQGARQIEPKVMQVLVALNRRNGAVVSRSELHETCWSSRIVSDDSLNRAMTVIRRISKESGPEGFELQTISKVGYRLRARQAGPEASPEIVLAVLPFEFEGAEAESSWLSDGIAEEILETLARGSNIRVIGRSSSFQFRGAAKAVNVVRAALGVTHVLDGSVRREADHVRVTVQLVEVEKETIVWSDWIDEPNDAMLNLRDRVAEHVATALDRAFAARSRPARVESRAFELYLRGAEFTRDINPQSQSRAVALLAECVKLAPDFADAWGALALARVQLGFFEEQPRETRELAQAEARRALELDPRCNCAKLVPYVGGRVFDFSQHRIFELPAPSTHGRSASPDVSFGVQMLEQGRAAEALEFFIQAARYDPLFQIQLYYQSFALLCAGKVDDGLKMLDEAAVRWPGLPFFLAARLKWAAVAGEWTIIEHHLAGDPTLTGSVGHRAADIRAWIEFSRNPAPTFEEFLSLRADAFAARRSGLEELLLYAKAVGLEEALDRVDRAGHVIVNLDASRTPDELGAIALWLPLYNRLRGSPAFSILTTRILQTAMH